MSLITIFSKTFKCLKIAWVPQTEKGNFQLSTSEKLDL